MSFEKAPRPAPGEVIEPVRPKAGQMDALVLPVQRLIAGEFVFWRREVRRSSPRSQFGKLALRYSAHFGAMQEEYDRMQQVAHSAILGRAALAIADWYSDVAVMLPYSRLLRTPRILETIKSGYTPEETAPDSLLLDYMHNEKDKTGVHLGVADLDAYEFPHVPNGKEEWYEGGSILIRARRPAEPTAELTSVYRKEYNNKRLDRAAFISYSARMKMTTWVGMGDD